MSQQRLETKVVLSWEQYQKLLKAAKANQSNRQTGSAPAETNRVHPSEITSTALLPLQKGYGEADRLTPGNLQDIRDSSFRTPLPAIVPMLGVSESGGGAVEHAADGRTIGRFVESVKKNMRNKARNLLTVLLDHPGKVTWDSHGDVYIDQKWAGQLHVLLPMTFSGSRRAQIPGLEAWFKMLAQLGLNHLVTNRSQPTPKKSRASKRTEDMQGEGTPLAPAAASADYLALVPREDAPEGVQVPSVPSEDAPQIKRKWYKVK
jgi:hypothetical protein